MLFSSMTFIFIFLPVVCLLYFLARRELKNNILLLTSLVFYGWGEPRYLAVMLLTVLINYLGATFISRSNNETHRKLLLAATILADLSCLFYFKYFNFVAGMFNENWTLKDIVLPVGISFYTFQAISYVTDVYRRDIPAQRDIYKLALYICLFPQMMAGPIVKYHDVAAQIDSRDVTFKNVAYGVKRFIIGLAKKMLLANTLGAVADKVFALPADQFDAATAWLGAFAYSFQLFYDFSGYSDMAIGLGYVFGFKFRENFNYPYISKSITEFWRRWHISLSTWFKEYLYIPLGGNRVSKPRNYFNLFVVFLATGIWHGAGWNFVVWGLWHGFFIILEKATGWHKKEGGFLLSAAKHLYTIFAFVLGWVMFRADNLTHAAAYLQNMFGLGKGENAYTLAYFADNLEIAAFAAAVVCAVPVFKNMLHIFTRHALLRAAVNLLLLALFAVSVSAIASGTYNPFIYFRF